MKRALITGISGYIGSNLSCHLLKRGWHVEGVVRDLKSISKYPILGSIKYHLVDINDYTTFVKAISKSKPDVIFHLASLFIVEHRPENILNLISSNISFGTQLVEAMCAEGTSRIINVGTSWQHFKNSSYLPVNLYSATKMAFENIMEYYKDVFGIKIATVKLFDTYGPGDQRQKLIPTLIRAARSGEQMILSPGDQLINLVFIDDVVNAFETVANNMFNNEINDKVSDWAVASNSPISLREIVATFCSEFHAELNINWGGRAYRKREVMIPWTNFSNIPGWTQRIPLSEGLKLIANHEKFHQKMI